MSIQSFYYVLGGPKHLYGLVYGSYDMLAILSLPLISYVSDLTHTYKWLILLCMSLNLIGNILYGICFAVDAWWMMLVARLIAGIGSSAHALGSSYIADTTTQEQRQKRLVTYDITKMSARYLGSCAGYIFIALPLVTESSTGALRVINWYTIPGWAASVMMVLAIGIFFWMFKDPTVENEHITRRIEVEGERDSSVCTQSRNKFSWFCGLWIALSFTTSLLNNAFYSNLFALFAGQYHLLSTQRDLWKVHLGLGLGAVSASVLYRIGVSKWKRVVDERKVVIASRWTMVVVLLLVIPYGSSFALPPSPSPVLFYVSTAIFGFASVLSWPAMEALYSKKLTQFQTTIGNHRSRLISMFYISSWVGSVAGAFIMGAVTYISTPDGRQQYCAGGVGQGPRGERICQADQSTGSDRTLSCAIFSNDLYLEGCVLKNADIAYGVSAGLAALVAIASTWIVIAHWSYDIVQPCGDSSSGSNRRDGSNQAYGDLKKCSKKSEFENIPV